MPYFLYSRNTYTYIMYLYMTYIEKQIATAFVMVKTI